MKQKTDGSGPVEGQAQWPLAVITFVPAGGNVEFEHQRQRTGVPETKEVGNHTLVKHVPVSPAAGKPRLMRKACLSCLALDVDKPRPLTILFCLTKGHSNCCSFHRFVELHFRYSWLSRRAGYRKPFSFLAGLQFRHRIGSPTKGGLLNHRADSLTSSIITVVILRPGSWSSCLLIFLNSYPCPTYLSLLCARSRHRSFVNYRLCNPPTLHHVHLQSFRRSVPNLAIVE